MTARELPRKRERSEMERVAPPALLAMESVSDGCVVDSKGQRSAQYDVSEHSVTSACTE